MLSTRRPDGAEEQKSCGEHGASERQGCRRPMQGCMFQAAWTPPANPGKDASCRRPVQGRTHRAALRASALPRSLIPHTVFHEGSCEYFTFFSWNISQPKSSYFCILTRKPK